MIHGVAIGCHDPPGGRRRSRRLGDHNGPGSTPLLGCFISADGAPSGSAPLTAREQPARPPLHHQAQGFSARASNSIQGGAGR